jgi:hypothetical protein
VFFAGENPILGQAHELLPDPKSVGRREKRPGVDLASEHEKENYSICRAV